MKTKKDNYTISKRCPKCNKEIIMQRFSVHKDWADKVYNKAIDDLLKVSKSKCYSEERVYEEDSKDLVEVIEIRKLEQIAKELKNGT